MSNVKKISQIISYNFSDETLLIESLTHTGKNRRKNSIFQRLEFLGDRVLGLCIAKILFDINEEDYNFTIHQAPEGSVMRRCPDVAKIKSIGYKKEFPLEKGLQATIDWYKG